MSPRKRGEPGPFCVAHDTSGFWLLPFAFWLLASALPSAFCLPASGFRLPASGFWLLVACLTLIGPHISQCWTGRLHSP